MTIDIMKKYTLLTYRAVYHKECAVVGKIDGDVFECPKCGKEFVEGSDNWIVGWGLTQESTAQDLVMKVDIYLRDIFGLIHKQMNRGPPTSSVS